MRRLRIGVLVTVWLTIAAPAAAQRYTAVVVWAPKPQNFICFEPMAGITNAINMAHKGTYQELQTVAPGGTWRESFWIRPGGF